jgi:phosphatidylserine decarboxylase
VRGRIVSPSPHAADVLLHLRYKGPHQIACDAVYAKGQEMGWFQHGSTILVFVPPGWSLPQGIASGERIHMGQALLERTLDQSVSRVTD